MDAFRYQEQELYCENVPLSELVEEFGTPLYVYSRNRVIENFRTLEAPLAGTEHTICYALKANANTALLKILAQEGAGADVVSAGELYLALKAGFPPERCGARVRPVHSIADGKGGCAHPWRRSLE